MGKQIEIADLIEGTSWQVGTVTRDASETREGASGHVGTLAWGTPLRGQGDTGTR